MNPVFSLKNYSYHLPQRLIAQAPLDDRSFSRLLTLERETGKMTHKRFYDLPNLLTADDCLILNNSKVFPARLEGQKATGGKVEVFLLHLPVMISEGKARASALLRSSKPCKEGHEIRYKNDFRIIVKKNLNGKSEVEIFFSGDMEAAINESGKVPLPPYIKRPAESRDSRRYQTVYAKETGSVAAPTAGLHFTDDLLTCIKEKGVKVEWITLHVGYGTFSPIRHEDIRKHRLHQEWVNVPQNAIDAIKQTKACGGRVVAVGTTAARAIEASWQADYGFRAYEGMCGLYIMPGYRFKVIDALVTNFHLPCSSLLVLASAFAGRENILAAYKEAVSKGYRFYSYGDAMFIT